MTTGQLIKAARKDAGLTQKELGAKLGVAYQTLAQWENDLRNPKYETLQRIAIALNVPLVKLWSELTIDFRDIIKTRRAKLGLTLDDIAHYVGVSEATVSRWESGGIENVRTDVIAKLAEVLRVSPAYLMGWENDFGEQDLFLTAIDVAESLKAPRVLVLDVMEDMGWFDATDSETLRKISAEVERRKIPPEILNEISYSLYKLNPAGRKKVSDYAEDLTKIPEYQAKASAEDE